MKFKVGDRVRFTETMAEYPMKPNEVWRARTSYIDEQGETYYSEPWADWLIEEVFEDAMRARCIRSYTTHSRKRFGFNRDNAQRIPMNWEEVDGWELRASAVPPPKCCVCAVCESSFYIPRSAKEDYLCPGCRIV